MGSTEGLWPGDSFKPALLTLLKQNTSFNARLNRMAERTSIKMSYARFGPDSNVYVYGDLGGKLHCCSCSLSTNNSDYTTYRYSAMLRHLRKHQEKEQAVPEYTLENLGRERVLFSDNGKNWDYDIAYPSVIRKEF